MIEYRSASSTFPPMAWAVVGQMCPSQPVVRLDRLYFYRRARRNSPVRLQVRVTGPPAHLIRVSSRQQLGPCEGRPWTIRPSPSPRGAAATGCASESACSGAAPRATGHGGSTRSTVRAPMLRGRLRAASTNPWTRGGLHPCPGAAGPRMPCASSPSPPPADSLASPTGSGGPFTALPSTRHWLSLTWARPASPGLPVQPSGRPGRGLVRGAGRADATVATQQPQQPQQAQQAQETQEARERAGVWAGSAGLGGSVGPGAGVPRRVLQGRVAGRAQGDAAVGIPDAGDKGARGGRDGGGRGVGRGRE